MFRAFTQDFSFAQDWGAGQKNGFSLLLRYLPSMLPWFYSNGHLSAIYFSVASRTTHANDTFLSLAISSRVS